MTPFIDLPVDTMSQDEKRFFRELGSRIAQLRKAQGLTQQQLAQNLDTTQQQIASYEGARLRVPVSLLPALASTLNVSVEELIGQPANRPKAKRGPAPRLVHHMERISQLPKPKQRFVLQMLDAVLAQASR